MTREHHLDRRPKNLNNTRNVYTAVVEISLGLVGGLFGFWQMIQGRQWPPDAINVVATLSGLILVALGFERLWVVRDIEEELRRVRRRLKGPNGAAYLMKDATYLAARDMLVRAERHRRPGQRILITDLPGTRLEQEELSPGRAEALYHDQWREIVRGGRGARLVRQIVNVATTKRLEYWLESVDEFKDIREGFELRVHAHVGDLPHADILAVSDLGALVGFRGSGAPGNACAIRLDGAAAFHVAQNAFDLIWDDAIVIFKNGRPNDDGIARVRQMLTHEPITIINERGQLFREAQEVVQRARRRIWVTSMGMATSEVHGFVDFLDRVVGKLNDTKEEIEFRRAFHATSKQRWDGHSWKGMYRQRVEGLKRAAVRFFPEIPDVPAILLTDNEVVIAIKDKQSDDLRRGVILRDPSIVEMFREWYSEFIWQASGSIDLKRPGETQIDEDGERRVEELLQRETA